MTMRDPSILRSNFFLLRLQEIGILPVPCFVCLPIKYSCAHPFRIPVENKSIDNFLSPWVTINLASRQQISRITLANQTTRDGNPSLPRSRFCLVTRQKRLRGRLRESRLMCKPRYAWVFRPLFREKMIFPLCEWAGNAPAFETCQPT